MKLTGITRRIDNLGRIVIPKEIRNNMHISNGDLLDISILSNNEILLRKYSLINENIDYINNYIKILSKLLNCNVYITDKEKIIFSSKDEFVNKKIEVIRDNKVLIDEIYIKQRKAFKLLPNGDFCGYLIFDSIDESKKDLIDLSVKYITESLEIL